MTYNIILDIKYHIISFSTYYNKQNAPIINGKYETPNLFNWKMKLILFSTPIAIYNHIRKIFAVW